MVSNDLIRTLAYADVFNYPLTYEEMWRFVIAEIKMSQHVFKREVLEAKKKKLISEKNNFFCFWGRESIIGQRIRREAISQKKLHIAKKTGVYLSTIPSVFFIGVSGNLAMKNVEENDDIDFFIITKERTIWITRLLLIILLKCKGIHREKGQKFVKDRICINMLIDESVLALPLVTRNMYTAHEVVQVMPLFNRNNAYERFLKANVWVKRFLPNAFEHRITQNRTQNNTESVFSVFLRQVLRISALEFLAKRLQLWYMKKHISTETISDILLAFHPHDYRSSILQSYTKKTAKYARV